MEIKTYHFTWEPEYDVNAYMAAPFGGETLEFAHPRSIYVLPNTLRFEDTYTNEITVLASKVVVV